MLTALRETLDVVRARGASQPFVRETMSETLAELRRNGAGGTALRVGEAFPDFLLPDTDGSLVSLEDLLRAGPAAITFFRGEWCPYCRATLDALEAALPAIRDAGGILAAVTPETGGRALDAKTTAKAGYTVMVDVDSGLAATCGVAFRVPGAYRRMLLRSGVDLAERQGNAAWLLPVPATFVVARDGTVSWAHVDADFTRRAEPADVARALAASR